MQGLMIKLLAWLLAAGLQCGDLDKNLPRLGCGNMPPGVAAQYFPSANRIFIDCNTRYFEATVLHELVHACHTWTGKLPPTTGGDKEVCVLYLDSEVLAYELTNQYTREKYGWNLFSQDTVDRALWDGWDFCMEK